MKKRRKNGIIGPRSSSPAKSPYRIASSGKVTTKGAPGGQNDPAYRNPKRGR